jgi:ATP-dependent Clp protease adapter protein ClpS
MIRETGGDPQLLAAELQAAAEETQPGGFAGFLTFFGASGAEFRRPIAFAAIQRLSSSKTEVRSADVFVAGFASSNPRLVSLLEGAGVSRLRLLRWLCGDQAQGLEPAWPDGELLDVVLLNDDYTTMATVVKLLKAVFGLDDLRAYRTMMTVHREGSASVGRYPRDEAAGLVRTAVEMAEVDDAPLRIVLRRPEDRAAPQPADGVTAQRATLRAATEVFLATLVRRLTWRTVAADGVASADSMIFACAVAGLAVWLAFDRYAAGLAPQWNPSGLTGVTWFATGLLALVWVLHRTSAAAGSFRELLAAIVGALPLPFALALSVENWAPTVARNPAYLILALGATLRANWALASIGARRPRIALLAAAGFIAVFTWGTGRSFVYPHVWFANHDDEGPREWAATERLLFEQADRIDEAAARLRGGETGRSDVFFLGFAGVGEEKVFAEEIKLSERVVSDRYNAAGRTLLLVNDRRDRETWPLATVHGLRRALARMADRMDRSEDVLFMMLTSHGSDKPLLSVSNGTWPLDQLDAKALRSALDKSRIKWRVVVISACHSGAFIEPLADENTIILASAAGNRTSFGCSDDRDLTDFGEAFIRDALPEAVSLAAAFDRAKEALAERERRSGLTASLPQAHFGKAITAHWDRIEAERAARRREPAAALKRQSLR